MLKAKVENVVSSNNLLVRIFDEAKSKNVKVLFKLMFLKKFYTELAEESSAYNQTRNKIFETHIKDRTTQPFVFNGETPEEQQKHSEDFFSEMTALAEGEVDIKIKPFTMEEIDAINLDRPFTPSELLSLFWLLDYNDFKEEEI